MLGVLSGTVRAGRGVCPTRDGTPVGRQGRDGDPLAVALRDAVATSAAVGVLALCLAVLVLLPG